MATTGILQRGAAPGIRYPAYFATAGYQLCENDPPRFLSESTLLEGAITAEMDFLSLATLCEALVDELIECQSATARLALAGRLACALERLDAALSRDIPPHRLAALTVAELPERLPEHLGSDTETLGQYCRALTAALITRALAPEIERTLAGLLFDLVNHLAEWVKTPCFVLTPQGYLNDEGQLVAPRDNAVS